MKAFSTQDCGRSLKYNISQQLAASRSRARKILENALEKNLKRELENRRSNVVVWLTANALVNEGMLTSYVFLL